MKLTKFGHCCLLIEDKGVKILTDPGSFSTIPTAVRNLNVILLTHEHQDHVHIDILKNILLTSRQAKIITNKAVKKQLETHGIPSGFMEHKESLLENGVLIEAYGTDHAAIYPSFAATANVGFMIGKRFFYPGDAFTVPDFPVEILALPVAGPWMKLSESIDYAREINPKICIPVHDGILKLSGLVHKIPTMVLEPLGIKILPLEDGKTIEL